MPTRFPLEALLAGGKVPVTTKGYKLPTVTGPTIRRGKGNGNAATPWPFIRAVEEKFGPLAVDLAASAANAKAPVWIDEKRNSLSADVGWSVLQGLLWLNCPYANITPWAKKCSEEGQAGARILLLVPASIGAVWFWTWVVPFADVYSVGRMVFDDCYDAQGKLVTTPYPKDLILCHYGPGTGKSYADAHLGGRAELIRWGWQDGG